MTDQSSQHSRRDVLKAAGIVAGTAMASGFIARTAYAGADDTVKIALVGAGGRGTGAAAQALSTTGQTKLIAVADAFEDNARNAVSNLKRQHADKVAVPQEQIFWGMDAYQKAIDAGPDVVILATPPGFRPMHFEAAVKAGKHVFMEKPVAVDPYGVRQVLAAAKVAKEKNLRVGVGLQRHHDAKYVETVKKIQDGAIGDPVLLRVYWNNGGVWVRGRKPGQSEMEYQMRNWYYFNWLCGDHINEQHIHNLDVANWVMNNHPVKAQGQGGRQVRTGLDNGEIFDHHMVEFTYADGTKMQSACRHIRGCWNSVSEHAHGTKGNADISGKRLFGRDGKDIWRAQGQAGNPYQVEHDVLFDAIRNNKPHFEAEHGASSTMTAIFGRMATYTGLELDWDQAMNSQIRIWPEKLAWDAPPPTVPDANGRYPIPMPGRSDGDDLWVRIYKEMAASAGKKK